MVRLSLIDLPGGDDHRGCQDTDPFVMEIPSQSPENEDTQSILQKEGRTPEQKLTQGE